MKETLSSKITKGRIMDEQYEMIFKEDVREFIQKLKEELEDTHGSSWVIQKALIDNLAGEELSNHSPQGVVEGSAEHHRSVATKQVIPLLYEQSEDALRGEDKPLKKDMSQLKEDLEFYDKATDYKEEPLKKGCKDCMVLHSPQNCSKKKGCGKVFHDEVGNPRWCGELCKECSGDEDECAN